MRNARHGRLVPRPLALLLALGLLAGACNGSGEGADDATTTTRGDATSTTGTDDGPLSGAAVIAHRGSSDYAPEHTFAAYDLAIEQGADYIEQDVQTTADGVLVALHDDTLDRTARGPAESCTGPVRDKTLAQLHECDFGVWFNEAHADRADPAYVGLAIPTMEEIVERYGTGVRYYIETKSPQDQPGMEEALLDLLDEAGLMAAPASGRVVIQSFSAESLQLVRSLQPELPLVQLLLVSSNPFDDATLDDIASYAVGIGPSKENADAALVEAAHARCLDVHPYTVDDPADMARLLDEGVEGMFTNTPDVLVTVREQHADPPDHCTASAGTG
jgi:glycerophosphoryl diester phosphodiesterase